MFIVDYYSLDFPDGSAGKESACNAGHVGSIPGSGISPGEGNGNPFQYPCLGNPMDRGAWRAIVCGVVKSQTRPNMSTHICVTHLCFMPGMHGRQPRCIMFQQRRASTYPCILPGMIMGVSQRVVNGAVWMSSLGSVLRRFPCRQTSVGEGNPRQGVGSTCKCPEAG